MKYLIREFTEFSLQRFGESPTAQATNHGLSQNAFDKHLDNIRTSNLRLNDILNTVRSTNNIYNLKNNSLMDGMEIKNLKILRMFPSNEIDLDVYISFDMGDQNYYGVINKFVTNPDLKSELFRDDNLFVNKEWVIKTKGNIIKVIKNWMNISPSKWKSLKDIQCTDVISGQIVNIPKDSEVNVLRTFDNSIIVTYDNRNCKLKGMNFYYFNYWFEEL